MLRFIICVLGDSQNISRAYKHAHDMDNVKQVRCVTSWATAPFERLEFCQSIHSLLN
jgi:hypothetical protein